MDWVLLGVLTVGGLTTAALVLLLLDAPREAPSAEDAGDEPDEGR